MDNETVAVWVDPYLYYVSVEDGTVLLRANLPDGAAFTDTIYTDALAEDGKVVLQRFNGDPAFTLYTADRMLFRGDSLFSVSPFLHSVSKWGSSDGQREWQHSFADVISVLDLAAGDTVLGMVSGRIALVDGTGDIRWLREGDGRPVLGISASGEALWAVIGGQQPWLEVRSFDNESRLLQQVDIPYSGELRTPVPIEAGRNSVVLSSLGKVLKKGRGLLDYGFDDYYFEFEHLPFAIGIYQAENDRAVQWDKVLRLEDLHRRAMLMQAGVDELNVRMLNDGFLLYNQAEAVRYRLVNSGEGTI
ncbi:MAG: hypothetical protein D6B26_05685 [Spirochaetaceae bacterium]|nr:MAG: hypothetical protein D6B26_05685 [Spirochaetaceae bacterium]